MQIQSALNAGLQGFQSASNKVAEAAADIAKQTAAPATESQLNEPVKQVAERQTPSVTDSLVSLKVAERDAEASAKVIRTADETLGTIIDTRV